MLTKTQAIIQGSYLFLFITMSISIVRNIEIGIKTPTGFLIIYMFVSFLTIGKIVYWFRHNELF